jgi:hypothetical protein
MNRILFPPPVVQASVADAPPMYTIDETMDSVSSGGRFERITGWFFSPLYGHPFMFTSLFGTTLIGLFYVIHKFT